MSNPRPEKVAEVEELQKRLQSSAVVILTDYRGLSVGEIGALRAKLRDAAIEYRVTKNTLLGRAAELAGVTGLEPYLVGPTAVVFGQDEPGVPARILQEFIRQYRKLEIKGGVVEGQALDPHGVQSLASLPTKLELMASLLGVIQGPMRGLVTVLTGPQRGLVTALDALRKRREEVGPATSAGAAPATDGGAAPVASAGEAPVTAGEVVAVASASEAPVAVGDAGSAMSAAESPVTAREEAPVASASGARPAVGDAGSATPTGQSPVTEFGAGATAPADGKPVTEAEANPVDSATEESGTERGSPAGETGRTGS